MSTTAVHRPVIHAKRRSHLLHRRVPLAGLALLSAMACCKTARADGVQVYGIVDVGIALQRGNAAGSVAKVTSGIESGSRLGFKGREDLGDGASAFFVIETGFSADTGGGAQGVSKANPLGVVWGRQTLVGLQSPKYGTLSLGRTYTPVAVALITVGDPFAAGFSGTATNIFSTAGLRANNTVNYTSPAFGCFSFGAMVSLGEQVGNASHGRALGGHVDCTSGPLQVRAAHIQRRALTDGVDSARSTLLAAKYDFGPFRLHGMAEVNKGPGSDPYLGQLYLVAPEVHNPYGAATPPRPSTDSRDLLVGVSVPFGVSTFLASYIDHRDRTPLRQNASQFAVGATYALSKRTDLYSSVGLIRNRNGAGYTVGNNGDVTYGSGDRELSLGIRHVF